MRNAAPNFFAWLELSSSQEIKVGDYIKLETGEQGYVIDINPHNTRIKSIDESIIIVPNNRLLQYVARDLREFVEALRKISLGSLYFHVFESRLRLGRGLNDFSIWLKESLHEPELAEEIEKLDPYTYTLEGLRSAFIQLIEKHVQ